MTGPGDGAPGPGGVAGGLARRTWEVFDRALEEFAFAVEGVEVGSVRSVDSGGVARVRGLTRVRAEELLRFEGGLLGLAFNLDREEIGVVLLDAGAGIRAGSEVHRTERVLDVPVGPELLGRVVDPLGRPLDRRGPIAASLRRPCEREAPAIMDRLPVTRPLQTGIKVIDALFPIGRGQRELILGDRQTGKTAIAIDTILNQADQGVISVYCAIGQRSSAVARVIARLRDADALSRSVVVVAEGDVPSGLQFIAPYAATTIAEHFMEKGQDVLVVYDDLTAHARAYRALSLLLRRPPGREAFPGDIFYVHSRLLERATRLCEERGGGSLTALPIAETEAQNVSAYIPTNLISITDGQLYLSPLLFRKGAMPAVEVSRSVSRVGGKAQRDAYRAVAGDLRLMHAQFEELEAFSRFSARLDEDTRRRLERGRRVREVFRQPEASPVDVPAQIAVLHAVARGVLDAVDLDAVAAAERRIGRAIHASRPDLCARILDGGPLDEAMLDDLEALARRSLAEPDDADA